MTENLKYNEVYTWEEIGKVYPDMYAFITDVKYDKYEEIKKCKLLKVVPYERKDQTILEYIKQGIEFDCERTTFSAPNVGVLC